MFTSITCIFYSLKGGPSHPLTEISLSLKIDSFKTFKRRENINNLIPGRILKVCHQSHNRNEKDIYLSERLNARRQHAEWRHDHVIKFSNSLELEDQCHGRLPVSIGPAHPSVGRRGVRPGIHQWDGLPKKSVRQKSESVLQTPVVFTLFPIVDVLKEKVGRKFVT